MSLSLKSKSFDKFGPIPKEFTGEGANTSPSLVWENLPEGTQELALICDDPDAPTVSPFVHWVAYKIPVNIEELPEGISHTERPPEVPGMLQGLTSFDKTGYGGPMPPKGHGVHHYHFKLYALDIKIPDIEGLDKTQLIKKMEGHILGKAEYIGTYKR